MYGGSSRRGESPVSAHEARRDLDGAFAPSGDLPLSSGDLDLGESRGECWGDDSVETSDKRLAAAAAAAEAK